MASKTVNSTVADALSSAYSELQSLAEEVREVVDNASGTNRENTERIQTLDSTASTLEDINEIDVDGEIGKLPVTYVEQLPPKRGLSRSARRDNALNMIEAALQEVQEKSDEWTEGGQGSEENPYEGLIQEIEEMQGNAEAAEFPGMFG